MGCTAQATQIIDAVLDRGRIRALPLVGAGIADEVAALREGSVGGRGLGGLESPS